jgi:hypothetical protein
MRARTLLIGAVAWSASSIGPARADDPADPDPGAEEPASSELAATQADAQAAAAAAAVDGEIAAIPDLDKIRAPDSPAFLLLGVSPAEIQRPTSPRELSVALGSFVSSGSLVVPDSLSVEVAPYWLFSHPGLTGDELARSSWWQTLGRNFTASLGTTARTIAVGDGMGGTVDSSVTDLALGLRSRVLDGRRRVSCWGGVEAAASAIAARQGAVLAAAAGEIAARHPFETAAPRASAAEQDAVERRNRKARAAIAAELELIRLRELDAEVEARTRLTELAARCMEASAARTGLVGDVAMGGSLRFPESRFADGDWLAAGAWLTLAWQGANHDLIGLGRALADRADGDADLVLDLGGRYVYVRGRYALSAEVIYRRLGDSAGDDEGERNLFRVDLATDMRLYGSVWLTATFGRDFAAADAGEVFALANLKWGLGGPTIELPGAE